MRCFVIFEYYTKEKAGFDSVLFCFRIKRRKNLRIYIGGFTRV